MHVRSALKWMLALGFVAYAAAPAGAQLQPASAGAGGATEPAADGNVAFQRKTQLSPAEQLSEAGRHIARMEGTGKAVSQQLADARRQRDVVKILCLGDKLSQIGVAIRSAKERRGSLEAAVKRNDSELANHEFTILTVLRQRAEQIAAEANQCIGQESAFVGATKVTTTVDPTIPQDETPYPAGDPGIVALPPPCVSCTL